MNKKLKILLLQLFVVFGGASPVFSFDEPGENWRYNLTQPKLQPNPPEDQRIVPRVDGRPQSAKDFEFLFTGQEDEASVRLSTRPYIKQYTFREKVRYAVEDKPAYASLLSGTVTSHGILTNGHGFVQEVPCIQNWFLEQFGSTNRYYRTLEPVIIEQGLTLNAFESKEEDSYFLPNSLPNVFESTHATYGREDVESVSLMEGYLVSLRTKGNGWIYGKINSDKDVALIKIKKNEYPEKVCQIAEKLPSVDAPPHKVSIYQYPLGHPLQKKSFGYADFFYKTHYCVTLPGSSGSGIRDFDTKNLIGIHKSGHKHYNGFIPFDVSMLSSMKVGIYPMGSFTQKD